MEQVLSLGTAQAASTARRSPRCRGFLLFQEVARQRTGTYRAAFCKPASSVPEINLQWGNHHCLVFFKLPHTFAMMQTCRHCEQPHWFGSSVSCQSSTFVTCTLRSSPAELISVAARALPKRIWALLQQLPEQLLSAVSGTTLAQEHPKGRPAPLPGQSRQQEPCNSRRMQNAAEQGPGMFKWNLFGQGLLAKPSLGCPSHASVLLLLRSTSLLVGARTTSFDKEARPAESPAPSTPC